MKIKLSPLGKNIFEQIIYMFISIIIMLLLCGVLIIYAIGLLSIFICINNYNTILYSLTTTSYAAHLFCFSCHYITIITIIVLIAFICYKVKEFLKKCFIIERN